MLTNENQNISSSSYPKETAGNLMVVDVPTVNENATIGDIEKLLLSQNNNFESINYIYVLNKNHQLTGVISIKELFRSPKNKAVQGFSSGNLITARTHTDQERIALLSLQHNLKAIPIVDKKEKFLGVITSDKILNILYNEDIEDILHLSGSAKIENPAINIIEGGTWLHFRKRFPWLFLGLLGGIAASFIVNSFENSIKKEIILASFIPAIVYMADAVGSQTQTIFIRSIAIRQKLDLKSYLWRELKVNFLIATLLGIIIFLFSLIWINTQIAFILGISITSTIIIAMIIAMILPWIFQKLKYDPAIASGPFATVVRDIASLLVYFLIISIFI